MARIQQGVILALVVLSAILARGQAAGANASIAVEGSFVQKVFNSLLPTIEADVLALVIPGESEKHFSFNSFSLSSFSVDAIVTSFQSPNVVVAGLNGLSLSVPQTDFSVFTHIFDPASNSDFKISCSGQFWGSITGSDVSLALAVQTLSDGKLQVLSVTPTINFGSVNINHNIDGFFCKVGQDIIQLFLGNLNTYITNIAENELPGIISNSVQNAANNGLPNLPINFVSQPLVVNDTVQLMVELLPPLFSSRFASQFATIPGLQHIGWVPQVFTDSDIEIGINTQSFNDVVAVGASLGLFSFNKTLDYNTTVLQPYLPAVYNACPGCPIAAGVRIQDNAPPTGLFNDGTMSFTFTNAILELSAKNVSNSFYTPLLAVYANLSFSLTNFSIDNMANNESRVTFQAALADLSLLSDYSVVGNLNVQQIGQLLEGLLQAYILPDFNAHFKGFRIEFMKDGYGLGDWVMVITQDSIYLGANVVLP